MRLDGLVVVLHPRVDALANPMNNVFVNSKGR